MFGDVSNVCNPPRHQRRCHHGEPWPVADDETEPALLLEVNHRVVCQAESQKNARRNVWRLQQGVLPTWLALRRAQSDYHRRR